MKKVADRLEISGIAERITVSTETVIGAVVLSFMLEGGCYAWGHSFGTGFFMSFQLYAATFIVLGSHEVLMALTRLLGWFFKCIMDHMSPLTRRARANALLEIIGREEFSWAPGELESSFRSIFLNVRRWAVGKEPLDGRIISDACQNNMTIVQGKLQKLFGTSEEIPEHEVFGGGSILRGERSCLVSWAEERSRSALEVRTPKQSLEA